MPKEPLQIVELMQPRCARRFGDAIQPSGVPVLTRVNLDPISNSQLNRTASVLFHAQVSFPSPWSEADGVIWEQGGSGVGAYLGVTSGSLVFRAGDGSTAAGTTGTAMVSVDGSVLAGLTVRIRAEILVPAGSVKLSVFRLDGRVLLEAQHTAPAGFTLWAGTDEGAIGRSSTANGVPVGVSPENFTGSIGTVSFFAGDFSGGCTATTARGPRCYNCWGTCLDLPNYTGEGSISWRFVKPAQALEPMYSRTGEHIKTNALPLLRSVSVQSSRINVGSVRDGEKPLGITGKATIQLIEGFFDDYVGDYYRDLRANTDGNFWAKWVARNPFYANMHVTIHEGYYGDALEDMTKRLYILDNVSGPNSDGSVTLTAVDPLRLTEAKRAQFPRETDMRLGGDIDASTTSITIEAAVEADLLDQFGNTTTSYLLIGSEVIGYTGYSGADGVWELSGVTRGVLGTTAVSHSDDDGAQRVGRYELMDAWDIAYDLLTGHTAVPAEFIDKPAWDAEAGTYLQGYSFSRTVVKPTPVNTLLGELLRDGTFYIWWDERSQLIPLKAVRPQQAVSSLSDNTAFVSGTVQLERAPDERISRVFIYYGQLDPTRGDDPTNFTRMRGRIEAEVESEVGGADVRTKTIYSKWIVSDAQAQEAALRLLARYRYSPKYLTVAMVDGTLLLGDAHNITSRLIVDTEGQPETRKWQVISAQTIRQGESVEYQLQEFLFQAARYGVWMADGAQGYMDYTPEEREELINVGFWTDDDGLMPDGSTGWLWQ